MTKTESKNCRWQLVRMTLHTMAKTKTKDKHRIEELSVTTWRRLWRLIACHAHYGTLSYTLPCLSFWVRGYHIKLRVWEYLSALPHCFWYFQCPQNLANPEIYLDVPKDPPKQANSQHFSSIANRQQFPNDTYIRGPISHGTTLPLWTLNTEQ